MFDFGAQIENKALTETRNQKSEIGLQ